VVTPPEPGCWLHLDLEVRPSPIAGRGLFARAAVPAGTVVSRLGGRLVSTSGLRELVAQARDDDHQYVNTIVVDENSHLVLPPQTPNGRGNHSCDPNTWWLDAYTLTARRNITAEEEVTNDYATSTDQETFTMTCSCSSPLCRRVISGRDWQSAELQHRYGKHWVPLLLSRIRAEGDDARH